MRNLQNVIWNLKEIKLSMNIKKLNKVNLRRRKIKIAEQIQKKMEIKVTYMQISQYKSKQIACLQE